MKVACSIQRCLLCKNLIKFKSSRGETAINLLETLLKVTLYPDFFLNIRARNVIMAGSCSWKSHNQITRAFKKSNFKEVETVKILLKIAFIIIY